MDHFENIIEVKKLSKIFKVSKRDKEGFKASLKSLFKREYEMVNAVEGINFTVKKGEIRGLIGPNGAGKSTTIKILSGVLFPTGGEVNVMGYVPWAEREKYVKEIGVVFGQKSQLWWDLPPIDTFALNKNLYKIPDEVYNNNIEHFKKMLSIEEVVTRPTRQLSLGERMKCELVCALLHNPKLIYLDEPTIGLDVISKETIREFIKQINKERETTFILTTHDLADIEHLCENVTIINKGTVVFDDSLQKLKSQHSNSKLVDITLDQDVDDSVLNEFNVISKTLNTISLEVDLKSSGLKEELKNIIAKFPIQDMNVSDIPIEKVIKQIYSN